MLLEGEDEQHNCEAKKHFFKKSETSNLQYMLLTNPNVKFTIYAYAFFVFFLAAPLKGCLLAFSLAGVKV